MRFPSFGRDPAHLRPGGRIVGLVALLATCTLLVTACDPAPPPPPASPDPTRTITFKGLGAWWDVYDWSPTFTDGRQALGVSDVDRLADKGVQTLYIQTATFRRPDVVVLDPTLLRRIIDRAHGRGLRVVGWYLPEFNDVNFDLTRLVAIADFGGFDGVGIDIESTANPDVAARSTNLIAESGFMRGAYPNLPLAAIPVTPIIWEGLNHSWWPNFPYRQLVPFYDAWMPMAYWTFRTPDSGWKDPYRYTYESVVQLRRLTGDPNLPVHPIGGLAELMTTADVFWMNLALVDSNAIGGSIYDDASSPPVLYDALHLFRRELVK